LLFVVDLQGVVHDERSTTTDT